MCLKSVVFLCILTLQVLCKVTKGDLKLYRNFCEGIIRLSSNLAHYLSASCSLFLQGIKLIFFSSNTQIIVLQAPWTQNLAFKGRDYFLKHFHCSHCSMFLSRYFPKSRIQGRGRSHSQECISTSPQSPAWWSWSKPGRVSTFKFISFQFSNMWHWSKHSWFVKLIGWFCEIQSFHYASLVDKSWKFISAKWIGFWIPWIDSVYPCQINDSKSVYWKQKGEWLGSSSLGWLAFNYCVLSKLKQLLLFMIW